MPLEVVPEPSTEAVGGAADPPIASHSRKAGRDVGLDVPASGANYQMHPREGWAHNEFDAEGTRFYNGVHCMQPDRPAKRSVARLLLAITAVLFMAASAGFSALHHHPQAGSCASESCNICLAHATGSSAVASDLPVVLPTLEELAETVVVADEAVVSRAPLSADSRGPPILL